MGTISNSKLLSRLRSYLQTLSFKILVIIVSIVLISVVLVNTYPVLRTQELIVDSIRSDMLQTSNIIASSLSGLPALEKERIDAVMKILDIADTERVIVTDLYGKIVYDSAEHVRREGEYLMLPELVSALAGNDSFRCRYFRTAFESRACVPLYSTDTIMGAVYLYEYDSNQGALLVSMQQTVRTMTLFLLLFSLVLTIAFTSIIRGRMRRLSGAIAQVREGNYDHRIETKSRDELGQIAHEFNELSSRLGRTENLRRQFVSNASHELKTPLASIKLLTDSILQTEDMRKEDLHEFLGDISDEISRLTRITERLLTLTRLDSEPGTQLVPVNVGETASRAVRMLTPLAEHNHVTLMCQTADNCIVMAQEDGVYQIIFNLVENAIKYNRPDGSVRVISYVREGLVYCMIDDTGIGVPEAELERIFDRFYRVDKARARATGGTGLGLSIVRTTVEQYGGRVWAERRETEGTRFAFTIPALSEQEIAALESF
ncbi:MAG: HAMP domain-containing histidine kinase [Oscillospiraceae bacterium]|nr:HAMP domain-containing histidine kinase [Oscillospiraceae bacterium]